jgi:hypothetical protein
MGNGISRRWVAPVPPPCIWCAGTFSNLHTANQKILTCVPAQDYLGGVSEVDTGDFGLGISISEELVKTWRVLLSLGQIVDPQIHMHTNMIIFNHSSLCNIPHGPCQLRQYIRIT